MTEISVNLPVKSTANLPNVLPVDFGHPTGMDLAIIYDNVVRLLEAKGWTPHEAAKRAGVPDAIRNMRRKLDREIKGNGINAKTLGALATQFGVTTDYLKTRHEPRGPSGPGVRDAILAKIDYLDGERERAVAELMALDKAESPGSKKKRDR